VTDALPKFELSEREVVSLIFAMGNVVDEGKKMIDQMPPEQRVQLTEAVDLYEKLISILPASRQATVRMVMKMTR